MTPSTRRRTSGRLAISAFDTPNLTRRADAPPSPTAGPGGEGRTDGSPPLSGPPQAGHLSPYTEKGPPPPVPARIIPGLVTPEGVEEARLDWGEESNLWMVRVLGEFPKAGDSSLLSLEWLEAAGDVPESEEPGGERKYSLGVDVARSGSDMTVLTLLRGNTVVSMDMWRGQDTMRTAGRVRELRDTYRREGSDVTIAIDDGGVGGGVVDRLKEQGVSLHAVSFGAAAEGKMQARFKNRVSEMYWVLREELRQKRLRIPRDLPNGLAVKLQAQLTQIEWELESDKAIRVHKRGLDGRRPSPDLADALALAVEARNRGERGVGVWI